MSTVFFRIKSLNCQTSSNFNDYFATARTNLQVQKEKLAIIDHHLISKQIFALKITPEVDTITITLTRSVPFSNEEEFAICVFPVENISPNIVIHETFMMDTPSEQKYIKITLDIHNNSDNTAPFYAPPGEWTGNYPITVPKSRKLSKVPLAIDVRSSLNNFDKIPPLSPVPPRPNKLTRGLPASKSSRPGSFRNFLNSPTVSAEYTLL